MKEDKNFIAVHIGERYERRDGQKAIVYNFDSVHQWYDCVILGTQSFFTVYEDGKYLESRDSHNDLVKRLD